MERRNRNGGWVRRHKSLLITLAAVAIVIALIVNEQVAILYLISTLGVAVLLIIVAYADLEGARKRPDSDESLGDDAAAIGDGRTTGWNARRAGAARATGARQRGA